MLASLAVAGHTLPEELIAEISELHGGALHEALSDLTGRDLVIAGADGYTIRHDLIRAAVYDSLLPGRRRHLHGRCAVTLSERGQVGAAAAEHWIAAGEVSRALPVAWQAARLAGKQNAHDERQHLLELILAHCDQAAPGTLLDIDRTTVLEQAAEAAFASGNSAAGVAHSTAALAALDPAQDPQRVAALLGLRGQLSNRIDGIGFLDLERAISLVPPGSADALRSRLLSALAFVGLPGHHHDEHRAAEALHIAEQLDDDALKAPALLVLASCDGRAGRLEQAQDRFATARRHAEAVGDEHIFLTTFQWEAGLLGDLGYYERAAEAARIGWLAAERLGRARSRGSMLAAVRAIPLYQLGRWNEADEVVQAALAENPPPLYTAYLRMISADIARCRGQGARVELLLRQVAEFTRHATGADEAKLMFAIQRIAWSLQQGEPEPADRTLGEILTELSPHRPAWQPYEAMRLAVLGARVQRARRAAAPRNRQLAEQIGQRLALLDRVVDAVTSASPAMTAYRLAFQAETAADRLSGWDRAAAAWRELGNRYETALALTDAAAAALASNNRPGARSRLSEARAIAADLGAEPLLARIDDLVARGRLAEDTNAAPRNEFGLTPRELDVLRSLAAGSSNPQIAAELFISTNTVATHVARILTKLGANTRTEAADRAHRCGLLANPDHAHLDRHSSAR